MVNNSLTFIDVSSGADYQFLANTNFQLAIVDGDSGLNSAQIASLQASGKTLLAYVSIGESEPYRSYWQPDWVSNPPSFLIGPDPNYPGDYSVKYWDPGWQKIVLGEVTSIAKAGYAGIMMDLAAAYQLPGVAAADGGMAKAESDMASFIEKISAAAKAINPNFKIIPNQGFELLTVDPNNPASASNTTYLAAIDGILSESTFYNPDNSATNYSLTTVQAIQHVKDAGKSVVDIEYPTSTAAQQAFIAAALAQGYVPYASDLQLDMTVASVNYQVPASLPAGALSSITGGGTSLSFSGTASQYIIVPVGDGASFTLTGPGYSGQPGKITALHFSDATEFIASLTPVTAGAVSSAQIACLYAACLARTPDAAGLAYYEQAATAYPTMPITQFASFFLGSPEYASNNAHSYAPTPSGDAQFVTDIYHTVLHRAPETGAVAWYLANVINPILVGLSPGSSAYSAGEVRAHAAVLADFSLSGEFFGLVAVTPQHPADAQHWLVLI